MVGQVAGCRVCGRPLPVFTVKRARMALAQLAEILSDGGEWQHDRDARAHALDYVRRTLAWSDARCPDCAKG